MRAAASASVGKRSYAEALGGYCDGRTKDDVDDRTGRIALEIWDRCTKEQQDVLYAITQAVAKRRREDVRLAAAALDAGFVGEDFETADDSGEGSGAYDAYAAGAADAVGEDGAERATQLSLVRDMLAQIQTQVSDIQFQLTQLRRVL